MSKHQLAYTIHKELILLNDRIDRKIIKGRSYGREASKHKILLRQLYMLRQKPARSNLFGMFLFR